MIETSNQNPFQKRIDLLAGAAATAWQVADQQTLTALADCERTLRKVARRAETLSGEWKRIEIRQQRGPVIEFTGRMLCEGSATINGRETLDLALEVWETRGGALVAVSASTLSGESGREEERALVVPASDDAQAMRFAVMDFFGWRQEAKRMVRKQLDWQLQVEVE